MTPNRRWSTWLTLATCWLLSCSSRAEEGPSQPEKRLLLSLARKSIDMHLASKSSPEVQPACLSTYLHKPLACFVTLKTAAGQLRGCIGMFQATEPLYKNVMDRAVAAATKDPRFRPVNREELEKLQLSVSILTQPKPLGTSSPDDLLTRLKPKRDGVILRSIHGSSTYLPQVWEQLPDKVQFLSHLCQKHGAPADCWKDGDTKVLTYRAIVFGDKEVQQIDQDFFVEGESYTCPQKKR